MATHEIKKKRNFPKYLVPIMQAEKNIPVVEMPDEKEHRNTVETIRKLMTDWNAKARAITQVINERSVGRETYDKKRSEYQNKLDTFQRKIESLENERKDLLLKIEDKVKEGRDMKNQLQTLKKSIGFKSEEDIEEKIKEIEYMLVTSTLSLKEEKKLLAEISTLKQHRPMVNKFVGWENNAQLFEENSLVPLKTKLNLVIEELSKIRKQKRDVYEKLKEVSQERQKVLEPLRSLYDERSALQSKAEEQHTKLKEIKSIYDSEMKLFLEYQQKLRALRSEKIKEERALKDLYNQRDELLIALEKEDYPPMTQEMILVKQLINYVKQTMDPHGLSTKNNEEKAKIERENNMVESAMKAKDKGESMLLPKHKRNEQYLYQPTKIKDKTKSKPVIPHSSKLVVDIVTISSFEELDMKVPLSTDDLPKTLEDLVKKDDQLQHEFDEKFANREKRKEEINIKLQQVEEKIISAGGLLDNEDQSVHRRNNEGQNE